MQGKKIFQLTVGPIATNCWIYPLSDEKAAVIDPGDEADLIISTLKKLSLCPDFILLTHGHFDHIGAVPSLAASFSSVSLQIAIHRLDSEYLGADSYKIHSLSIKAAMGDASFIDALWKKMPTADLLLEEGGTIGPLTVLHLPGHTSGSAAFWDKQAGVLFTGDTLFEDSWGRTDLPGGNERQIMASLNRLFKMDPNIKVYPGHGNTTTIGREAFA
jgi:glyoxylase-like metal-dependent hydrolase (beta-lactamase superfamily II)